MISINNLNFCNHMVEREKNGLGVLVLKLSSFTFQSKFNALRYTAPPTSATSRNTTIPTSPALKHKCHINITVPKCCLSLECCIQDDLTS